MSDSQTALTRNGRIEFVCGSVVISIFATILLHCFLVHAVTGDKATLAGTSISTLIAATTAGLWASQTRPPRWLLFGVLVLVPAAIGIVVLCVRATELIAKIG